MENKIQCPSCGHQFSMEDALSEELLTKIRTEERDKVSREKDKESQQKIDRMENQNKKIKKENTKLKRKEILILEKEKELENEKEEMELRLREKFLEREKKLKEKSDERARNRYEIQKKEDIRKAVDKAIDEQSRSSSLREEDLRETLTLVKKEYEKKLSDAEKKTKEAQQKLSQGSQQLQGEVQELALEELLEKEYPFDKIEEVPKGMRGADIIQAVINERQQECGKIIYESKRTKSFSEEWISKLRQDQIDCEAKFAVLVTQALPKDIDLKNGFGEKEGIFICSFHTIKEISSILRNILIEKIHPIEIAQKNKGSKMEVLYAYFISDEFSQKIKGIIEVYTEMKIQLEKEKRASERAFAMREKQINRVQKNISVLFGDIKGIGGEDVSNLAILELPE